MREVSPDPDDRFVDGDRLDRIRSRLAASEFDGLLAFAPANSYYLTGCYAGMYSRPVVGLVTAEDSLFVGPALEAAKAERTSWADRVVCYEDADDPFAVAGKAIAEAEPTRLGIDRADATPGWVDGVDATTDASLVDASDVFLDLRTVKTDWEIEMIRRAADLAGAGTRAILDGVRAGRPELAVVADVQRAFYDTYLDEHPGYDIGTANELGQYGFASVLSGDHALEPHSISSAREIAGGESVVGIALPSLQGYVCEEERTLLVGDVPAAIERRMETLVSVRNEAMDRVGPGEATDEIDAWVAGKLDDAGFGNDVMHRTGHGEGVTIHEGPALNARQPGELRPGMVISIEPGLYVRDHGTALRHSDTLVVTEDGAERLTHTSDGVLRG